MSEQQPSSPPPDAAWYRALTLKDRAALRRGCAPPQPAAADLDSARRRAARWGEEPAFRGGRRLAERLAADGLDEREWLEILAQPPHALKARLPERPAWLGDVLDAYAAAAPDGAPPPWDLSAADGRRRSAAGLLVAIEPLVRRFRQRLDAGLAALPREGRAPSLDPAGLGERLAAALVPLLVARVDRVLVLEMHVARLEGRLAGGSAGERYQSYLERLRDPGVALGLLRDYPVLARQLWIQLDQWLSSSLEFARRLWADWPEIRHGLAGGGDPGPLVGLEVGAGDRHRRGRSVVLAAFGSGFRLVYKPKPLALDRHFQELLAWANARGLEPELRTLAVLDRGAYGWLEFAAAGPCATVDGVRRFYRRQGSLMALLNLLKGTDFHFENVIAAGEHPVLVDLETLLHPALRVTQDAAERLAEDQYLHSVLWSGMLPQWVWGSDSSKGIEISGLGGRGGQQAPFDAPGWSETGTDAMRWSRQRVALESGRNRPSLAGQDVDPLEHAEAVVEGFTAAYELLLRNREALRAADGPLARFADDEVRVILRPSQRYSVMIHDAFHPDLLRDGLDRDRFFDRLWLDVDALPALARVLPAERADLDNADIPLFTSRPRSRDLWTSSGERIAEFFEASSLELVERGLERMGAEDLERQRWLIRAALGTLRDGSPSRVQRSGGLPAGAPPAAPAELLDAARAVGRRLGVLALSSREDAIWIGLTLQGKASALAPVDAGLYNGAPGIALFLAYLGQVTGDERHTELARAAVNAWCRRLERPTALASIGAHDGWGAALYALCHFGVLWGEPALLQRACDLAGRIEEKLEADGHLDLISGAAGALAALLGLQRCIPDPRLLAAATACGDHLLAKAQSAGQGIAWPSSAEVLAPLTGFAHGAAGIAWALLKLAAAGGGRRFHDAALQALAYERGAFVAAAGNWPDWRKLGDAAEAEVFFGTSWCHGAPGIGLGRVGALDVLDDADTRGEIEAAVATTLERGFGDGHSLCHGDLGNLELVMEAGRALGRDAWCLRGRRIAAGVLADIRQRGWICGTPENIESPGLMTGLAGIGYGLLRLAAPDRVPSVLLLEPPRGAAEAPAPTLRAAAAAGSR